MTAYPYLDLRQVERFRQQAAARRVGAEPRKRSGFIEALRATGNRPFSFDDLSEHTEPAAQRCAHPTGGTWEETRAAAIKKLLRKGPDDPTGSNAHLIQRGGKYKGQPTKWHLQLIMWGYSPKPDLLRHIPESLAA